jgi:hypothetical protein
LVDNAHSGFCTIDKNGCEQPLNDDDRNPASGVNVARAYYLLHRASKGDTTLEEVVAQFLEEKKRVGRSRHYDRLMKYSLGSFMDTVGKDKRVGKSLANKSPITSTART